MLKYLLNSQYFYLISQFYLKFEHSLKMWQFQDKNFKYQIDGSIFQYLNILYGDILHF